MRYDFVDLVTGCVIIGRITGVVRLLERFLGALLWDHGRVNDVLIYLVGLTRQLVGDVLLVAFVFRVQRR